MKGLLLFLLLLPCSLIRAQEGKEAPARIPVTQTWADLLKSKPVTVKTYHAIFSAPKQATPGRPVTISVRIGMDRSRVSSKGAVLFYCLIRGVIIKGNADQELGPFQIRIEKPATEEIKMLQVAGVQKPDDFRDSTYTLFTKVVSVDKPDTYIIDLTEPGDPSARSFHKVIARAEIHVAGEPILPWSPWADSVGQADLPNLTDKEGNFVPVRKVSNPTGNIANPKAPREFISYQEAPAGATPLPQLVPDQPDPSTQLALMGNTLIVTSSQYVHASQPFDPHELQHFFLTRWWVNDKPYVPDPNAPYQEMQDAEQEAWAFTLIKEVHFELDFHPERLNAKKGDKIGVQILYCPEGWKMGGPVQMDALMKAMMQKNETPPPPMAFSFPSNRIDFIYSGDPKNVQQK